MQLFTQSIPALVESLVDDPFYQAITDDLEGRKRVLASYFTYSLDEAARTGRCTVMEAEPKLGAAAWLLPRSAEVEASESIAKANYLAGILGVRGNKNYHRIVSFMSPLASQSIPADAWYLSIIGVLPTEQGRGIGAKLLRNTLQEAASAGVSCYLETFSSGNLGFYERLGFKEVARHHEPITDTEYSIMCRGA